MNIPDRWQAGKKGSDLVSIKVGGPIQHYSRPTTEAELWEDIALAKAAGLPVRVIGGGSNLLFADQGFMGLVIQPAFTHTELLSSEQAAVYAGQVEQFQAQSEAAPRYKKGEEEGVLHLADELPEEEGEPVLVKMGAGVPWGQAVMWSLTQQLIGLHWYARIPCQVGGAIFNNIHGAAHLLSEVVVAVEALDCQTGEKKIFGPQELDFGYDHSRFHQRNEVVAAAVFGLRRVSPTTAQSAKELYLNWTKEKTRVQPSGANCGSVFQNISEEQAREIGQTPLAAGWYIDQCGLRGIQEGGMQVYEKHANFIVNVGTGTQRDFIALVQRIRHTVQEKFSLTLEPEAECIDEQGNRLAW